MICSNLNHISAEAIIKGKPRAYFGVNVRVNGSDGSVQAIRQSRYIMQVNHRHERVDVKVLRQERLEEFCAPVKDGWHPGRDESRDRLSATPRITQPELKTGPSHAERGRSSSNG